MQEPLQARHVREETRCSRRKLADFLLGVPKMETASLVHPGDTKTRDTTTMRGHRILICVDRSEPADACLAYGIVLAQALGSELTLLHVLQPLAHHPDALDWEIARQEARAKLEQLEQQAAHALGRPA